MKRFYFNKLVRDNIVKRNKANSEVLHTEYKTLGDIEYRQELVRKLAEESAEIPLDGINRAEVIKELADLQAVVDALSDSFGVSPQELDGAVDAKLEEAGGFLLRHYIEYVDIVDSSQWVDIFRSQPEKYKEEDV